MTGKTIVAAVAVAVSLAGCAQRHKFAVFTTATTFGLDIVSQPDPNQPPHMVLGYRRLELVDIPRSMQKPDAVYSTFGEFCVTIDPFKPPWNTDDGLQIRSQFAVGEAADNLAAAQQKSFQDFIGKIKLGEGVSAGSRCFESQGTPASHGATGNSSHPSTNNQHGGSNDG